MQRDATSDNMRNRLRVRGHLYSNCFFKVLCISKSARIRPAVWFLLQVKTPCYKIIRHMGILHIPFLFVLAHDTILRFDVTRIF